ncbi:hypothetical protein AAC387_Pa01g0335 [Persea americana]
MKNEVAVVIVGAGPAGLATSACLNLLSISNIILERENCCASLWRHRAYDRLNLHLAKEFCHLPHMPHPPTAPTFIPRKDFIQYLEDYVSHFDVKPKYCRMVESAAFDGKAKRWCVMATNSESGVAEEYSCRFLVVATGENSKEFIPVVPGLESFNGEVLHSSKYKSGSKYSGKAVLVVGCGNSGMEIAYDLANYGAKSSIVVRSPFHVLTKEIVQLGMTLLKSSPCNMVDDLVLSLGKLHFADMTKYGIVRPSKGPFYLKETTGKSPVIDVGTLKKIESGDIQVLPELKRVDGNEAIFANGNSHRFDAIVFATGYRSTARKWLKEDDYLLNQDGMPKHDFPNHWKGKNGLYCAGFSRRGLAGLSMDAQNVANDIKMCYNNEM